MKTIELLIIDLDGTLADTKMDITTALNATLAQNGLPGFLPEVVAEYVGTGVTPLIKQRVSEANLPRFLEQFEASYLSHIADETRLYPGWDKVFQQWSGKKFYILTNKIQVFTNALVKALGLEQIIHAAYGREAFPERKPSPLPVLSILKEARVAPEKTMIIGDMPADLQSGKTAGILTCAALFGYGSRDILLELRPDYAIEGVEELLQMER